jgi:hypothetical protein
MKNAKKKERTLQTGSSSLETDEDQRIFSRPFRLIRLSDPIPDDFDQKQATFPDGNGRSLARDDLIADSILIVAAYFSVGKGII